MIIATVTAVAVTFGVVAFIALICIAVSKFENWLYSNHPDNRG